MLVAVVAAAWGLGAGPMLSDHEAIVAQGARQALQGDGWLVPHVGDAPFIRKPPTPFWLVGIASLLCDAPGDLPVSVYAARLPSAVAGILLTLLVYATGRMMFSHRVGVVGGLVQAVSLAGFYFAHNAQVEMLLALTCTAAIACFWRATEHRSRRALLAFYGCLGAAMMCKAPLPAAVVALPLAVWWLLVLPWIDRDSTPSAGGDATESRAERVSFRGRLVAQFRRIPQLLPIAGVGLFLLICLPWPLYVFFTVENALPLWAIEFVGRYAGELDAGRPFWYYLPFLFVFLFPFSFSMPEALAAPLLRRYAHYRRPLLYLLTWVAVVVVFLSTSPFKRPHYLASVLPGLALLIAVTVDSLFLAPRAIPRAKVLATTRVAQVLLPLACAGGAVAVWFEMRPALAAAIVAGVILSLTACFAARAFAAGQRGHSLLVLVVGTVLVYAWGWDALGRSGATERQVREAVALFRRHGVGPGDRLLWVAGRPDASLSYYLGERINPMLSALDVAPFRKSRREIARELLELGAQRLLEELQHPEPTYFIVRGDRWKQFMTDEHWADFRATAARNAREVFRVPGDKPDSDKDDWIVITNAAPEP